MHVIKKIYIYIKKKEEEILLEIIMSYILRLFTKVGTLIFSSKIITNITGKKFGRKGHPMTNSFTIINTVLRKLKYF